MQDSLKISKGVNQTSYIEGQTLYNDQKEKRQSKNKNGAQNTIRKKKQIEQHQPHNKTEDVLRSHRRVSSSCYNSTTHCVTRLKNPVNVRIVLELRDEIH